MWQIREIARLKKQLSEEIEVYGSVARGDFDEFSDLDIKIETESDFADVIKVLLNKRKIYGREIYEGENQTLFRLWLEDGQRFDVKLRRADFREDEELIYRQTSYSEKFWFLLTESVHKHIRGNLYVSLDLYTKALQLVFEKQWDQAEKVREQLLETIQTLSFKDEELIKHLVSVGKCWELMTGEKEQSALFERKYMHKE